MFTGTRLENAYKAFVPLLKHPEPELIGKACDGEGKNMKSTVYSGVMDKCNTVGRTMGA